MQRLKAKILFTAYMRLAYLVMFLCSPAILIAQYQNYDLAGYVNPDYTYKALDLNAKSNGSLSSRKNIYEYNSHYYNSYYFNDYFDNTSDDYANTAFGFEGDMRFNTYQNSLKKQTSQSFSINLSDNYDGTKQA